MVGVQVKDGAANRLEQKTAPPVRYATQLCGQSVDQPPPATRVVNNMGGFQLNVSAFHRSPSPRKVGSDLEGLFAKEIQDVRSPRLLVALGDGSDRAYAQSFAVHVGEHQRSRTLAALDVPSTRVERRAARVCESCTCSERLRGCSRVPRS